MTAMTAIAKQPIVNSRIVNLSAVRSTIQASMAPTIMTTALTATGISAKSITPPIHDNVAVLDYRPYKVRAKAVAELPVVGSVQDQ